MNNLRPNRKGPSVGATIGRPMLFGVEADNGRPMAAPTGIKSSHGANPWELFISLLLFQDASSKQG